MMTDQACAGASTRVASRRPRPSHAVRNDARLRVAALEVLGAVGWDSLSINRISQATGLANSVVLKRYPNKQSVGADLWHRECFDALTGALDAAIGSALTTEPSQRSEQSFLGAMKAFVHPPTQISAAIELALGTRFDPVLRPVVADELSAWLRARCLPAGIALNECRASQATAIVVWALGLVMFANRPWVADMDIAPALTHMHRALQRESPARRPPAKTATHLHTSVFDTGDPRIDEIMDLALASIGQVGYRRTHLREIAHSAGASEGFLFSRFRTKLDLFLAINAAAYNQAYEDMLTYQRAIAAQDGPGLAEAALWREYLDPAIAERQVVGVETDRLSIYEERVREITHAEEIKVVEAQLASTDPKVRQVMLGFVHLEFASGHGLPIVGLLLPQAWRLPFNVVTEPYLEGHPLA